ncbi:GHMP family kinase ATP-binding protein [Pseudoduganella chitinolytica]|uniref:GHMP kinase N-terminal domain-containing protein n=1 Tax=Pseudoduganella chitinolytica TaxID=34070 RepID=A0ABY8BCQ7_9BURK|nr:hypothetical protein [Pseudoduganella chitinolytica]WEF33704.1 hypothetical protein PX653_02625 [Pseudoduganella chitinolytica]
MTSISFAVDQAGAATQPDAAARHGVCSGVCHGTLGELIQGPYLEGGTAQISLISLPVRKYSCMHFTPHGAGPGDGLAAKTKCRLAIGHYLALHGRQLPAGCWTHDSELLEGKGMASSTADIVATIRCLDALFGIESQDAAIAAILGRIERSDSVFLDSYALYLSGRQQVVRRFGRTPAFHVCYIDEGGRVDTERVGSHLLGWYRDRLDAYLDNLEAAVGAFARGDAARIAACATASAVLGQPAIPKRNLDLLLRHQARHGADGVFVAHTGSLLGYLYIEPPAPARLGALSAFFRGLGYRAWFAQTGF